MRGVAVASKAIRDDASVVACIFTSRVLDDDCRQVFVSSNLRCCLVDLATLLQPLEGERETAFGETGSTCLASNFELRRKLERSDLGWICRWSQF